MAIAERPTPTRFTAGGTLPPDAPTYVERNADRELVACLEAGEFCYILDSRQKGKSSLLARAISRLRPLGYDIAHLDLQRYGTNLEPERWYAGLLSTVGQELGCTRELFEYWSERLELGPMHRWIGSLEAIVLPRIEQRLVIFVDEIDFVRSLSFNTDEFFAGIREVYNRRATHPIFKRLSFCLAGVATPSDLISSVLITPFNIGARINLTDFKLEECGPLTDALALTLNLSAAKQIIGRVLYWTGGHPYLTQTLCASIAQGKIDNIQGVDLMVQRLFLNERAASEEPNLRDVSRRILETQLPGLDEAESRAALLDLYRTVWRNREKVSDDETDSLKSALKLSGAVEAQGGKLYVRNRIYQDVFDRRWIAENMPDGERRRQRKAFLKGAKWAVLALATVTTLVHAVAVVIAWNITRAYHGELDVGLWELRQPLTFHAGTYGAMYRFVDADTGQTIFQVHGKQTDLGPKGTEVEIAWDDALLDHRNVRVLAHPVRWMAYVTRLVSPKSVVVPYSLGSLQIEPVPTLPKPIQTGADPWASRKLLAILIGMNHFGTPYVWGGDDLRKGIDCSHFVAKTFQDAGLPYFSPPVHQQELWGEVVWVRQGTSLIERGGQLYRVANVTSDWNALKTGDRMIFHYRPDGPHASSHHEGIYIGRYNNWPHAMINATGTRGISIRNLDSLSSMTCYAVRDFPGDGGHAKPLKDADVAISPIVIGQPCTVKVSKLKPDQYPIRVLILDRFGHELGALYSNSQEFTFVPVVDKLAIMIRDASGRSVFSNFNPPDEQPQSLPVQTLSD